ncbi:T9SS type A sorting domain-containing protein [Flavobacterium sp.]|uniref:T9SS type A sorting domain-containing protein n=1 Tax=Flavobacterium sp. TaxID=239 RepID=UPI004047EA72
MKSLKINLLKKVQYAFIAFLYCFYCHNYEILAQNQLYPTTFDLSTLNGSNGFEVSGLSTNLQFGAESQFIGDINNDGLEDIAFGSGTATASGLQYAGAAYIIFGSSVPYPSPFDLSTLDGSNGFTVDGVAYDERRGATITGPGDINGDGIDDLIIGSSSTSPDEIVIYGTTSFPALITINDINGTNGFLIDTPGSNQIVGLGDVNGDGINDFIIGTPHWSGQAWIVFGRSSNFPTSIDASWLDGTKGFKTSSFPGSRPSYKVGGAGDINNDGFKDILIGNWDSTDPAISYLLFGKGTPFSPLVDLTILDGTDGFSIDNNGGNFLTFVGALGDINNDGIDDFFSETNAIFGSTDPFPAHFPLSNLNGTDGFTLPGQLTSAGIGDVNLDGIDDFISVYGSGGRAYIVFGSTSGFPNPMNETTLNGVNGFIIEGLNSTNIARPVSGNGDINGDGISDFVVSSPYTPTTQIGKSYVIFGGDHYAMPLNVGYPQTENVTATALTLVVNGPETGTIHYAIFPGNNTGTVNYNDILNGTGAIANGNFLMNIQNGNVNNIVSSLPANSSFDVYLFLEDNAGNWTQIYDLNNVLDSEGFILSETDIYPNPTTSILNVNLTTEATYQLITINGQVIQKGKLINGKNAVDMSSLSKGLYFLSVKTDAGTATKKIMKK